MKYTFSIHGVPYGNQSWGNIIDSEYLKSFYNSVSAFNVPTQMIVDIRYSGNTICSYYHYLVLSNVDDYESRPGSYFGMTICFEGVYCSDFVELYELFDACFKKVALNSVLIKSGEGYKYALADFDSANNIATLKRVDSVIRKNIPLFEHNLVVFPKDFSPKHREDGWIEKWSIDDVGNKTFVNILLRDSMVSISPYYPVSYKKVEILQGDNRAKDSKIKTLESNNGNLQNENGELRAKITDQEKDIATKGATIKGQNVVITEHKGTITSLETEKVKLEKSLEETRRQIEDLKEELKQAQNNRDDETLQNCIKELKSIAQKRTHTDQLIDAINPRLKKAEENITLIGNQLNRGKSFRLTSSHFQFGALIVVAIIAIAGVLLPTHVSYNGEPYPNYLSKSDVQEMINKSLNPINETISNMKTIGNEQSIENYDGDKISFIDIQGNGTVKVGETYTLTAKKGSKPNLQKLTAGGGVFIVRLPDGQEETLESKDNGITASLHVEWDKFTIIYRYNDKDTFREVTAVTAVTPQ